MDDRPAEFGDAREGRGQVGDGEVREGCGIARAESTVMDPKAETAGVRLPPRSGRGGSGREVDVEDSGPEAASTTGVIGGELDQWCGHEHKYGANSSCIPGAGDRLSTRLTSVLRATCRNSYAQGFVLYKLYTYAAVLTA